MSPETFKKKVFEIGFSLSKHPCLYSRYFVSGTKSLILDNVKGGAYRLFLGVNCVPACQPSTADTQMHQIDAESPWFRYRDESSKREALGECWEWFQSVGIPFLNNPFAKELHMWISEHNILIRHKGVVIPVPRVRRLP